MEFSRVLGEGCVCTLSLKNNQVNQYSSHLDYILVLAFIRWFIKEYDGQGIHPLHGILVLDIPSDLNKIFLCNGYVPYLTNNLMHQLT